MMVHVVRTMGALQFTAQPFNSWSHHCYVTTLAADSSQSSVTQSWVN